MRSATKAGKGAIKASEQHEPENTVFSAMKTDGTAAKGTPGSVKKRSRKRKAVDAAWPWTHLRPSAEDVANNTRALGRNLIPWQRMLEVLHCNLTSELTSP